MKSDYMKFELNDNETFFGVYKDDPDCVMFSLHNNGDYLSMIYLNKKDVFELINKLIEMYGNMDED